MNFPKLNNKKLAEFVGIMLGDGCIGIYQCKSGDKIKIQYQMKVTLDSRHKDFIDYINKLIKSLFGINPRLNYKKNENTVDIRTFRKEVVRFILENVDLAISPKWGKAKIPKRYIKNQLELYVIRGLFDTDGSIIIANNNGTLYPLLEIKVCPSPMQQQIIEILERRKFNIKIYQLDKGKIKIRLNGKKELEKWLRIIGTSNKRYLEKAKIVLDYK